MQIILLENIRNLGNIGEIVKVKRGFARNYLIRQGKALNASKENVEIVKKKKDELNKKDLEKKQEAKKKHNVIHKKKYLFVKRAMENGVLYGSLKPKEITKQILDLDKIEIKPSAITLNKEINKTGNYKAKINLHSEIESEILIEVVNESDKEK
ncbi:MAG: 50S ribosomal protein L9 [Pelagibacteraceae bacterium]|nr:50S ribosomal protein L9 [Pelagibacteraceae bacterium]